jgi:hypothetical protein
MTIDLLERRTMGRPAHKTTFTAEDYLAWELTQLNRQEYLDGEVFADVMNP